MDLMQLTALSNEALALDAQIEAVEQTLKDLNKKRENIVCNLIPDGMFALGVTSLKLSNGRTVEVKDSLRASIRSYANISKLKNAEERTVLMEKRAKAFQWLRDNGLDGIIKTDLEVAFGPGQEAEADKAFKALESVGVEPVMTEEVNPATLSATLREMAARGEDIDYDLLNVTLMREAVIK